VIENNGLREKVWYVITDNDSNMVKAMSVLSDKGELFSLDDNDDQSLWEDMDADDVEAVFSNTHALHIQFSWW